MKQMTFTRFFTCLSAFIWGSSLLAQGLTMNSAPYSVVAGEQEVFQIDFDVPAPAAGVMSVLFNSNPFATIQTDIPYGAGDMFVNFTVDGIRPGVVEIHAVTFPGGVSPPLTSATTTVTVTNPSLMIHPNPPANLAVGQSTPIMLYRLGASTAALSVEFENTNPSIASTLPSTGYTFAAGETFMFITVTGQAEGTAQFRFKVGTYATGYYTQTVTEVAAPPELVAMAHGDLNRTGVYDEGDHVFVLFSNQVSADAATGARNVDNWAFYTNAGFPPTPSPNDSATHFGAGATIEPIDLQVYPLDFDPVDNGETFSRAFKITLGTNPVVNDGLFLTLDTTVTDINGITNPSPLPLVFPSLVDSNEDGLPDLWYLNYDLDPTGPSVADDDWDGDQITNLYEFLAGTDPLNPETVLGIPDALTDSFGMTLLDKQIRQLDPNSDDTDDDGISDVDEIAQGTDPLNPLDPEKSLAVEFDGSGRLRVQHDTQIGVNNVWTIEAWVQPEAAALLGQRVILRRMENEDQPSDRVIDYELGLEAGIPYVRYRSRNGLEERVNGLSALEADEWVHLAAVRDPTDNQLRLFVDGKRVAYKRPAHTQTSSSSAFAGQFEIVIGGGDLDGAGDATQGFIGQINAVRIWNYVRLGFLVQTERGVLFPEFTADGLPDADRAPTHLFNFDDGGTSFENFVVQNDWLNNWDNAAFMDSNGGVAEVVEFFPPANLDLDDDGIPDDDERLARTLFLRSESPYVHRALDFTGLGRVTVDELVDSTETRTYALPSWTVETWVYPDDTTAADVSLISRVGNQAGLRTFDLRLIKQPDGFRPTARFNRAGSSNQLLDVVSPQLIPADEWSHLAASFDDEAKVLKIFINGEQVVQRTFTDVTPWRNGNARLFLGDDLFVGKMNEIRIWNHARQGSNIQSDYRMVNLFNSGLVENSYSGAPGNYVSRITEEVEDGYRMDYSFPAITSGVNHTSGNLTHQFSMAAWVRMEPGSAGGVVTGRYAVFNLGGQDQRFANNQLQIDANGRPIGSWDGQVSQYILGVDGDGNQTVDTVIVPRTVQISSDLDLRDGQWHHIAIVGDGQRVELFVDGILERSSSYYTRIIIENGFESLFRTYAPVSSDVEVARGGFDGLIDEVIIMNTPVGEETLEIFKDFGIDRSFVTTNRTPSLLFPADAVNDGRPRVSLVSYLTFDGQLDLPFVTDVASPRDWRIRPATSGSEIVTNSGPPISVDKLRVFQEVKAGYFAASDGGNTVENYLFRNDLSYAGLLGNGVTFVDLGQNVDLPFITDTNGDGIPDWWYIQYGLEPAGPTAADENWDGTGLTNYWQYRLGADPNNAYSLDPSGLLNDAQYDSSGDGLSNAEKVQLGLNPALNDSDDNGIWDIHELEIGTDPTDDLSPFVLRYLHNDGSGRVEVPAVVPGIDDEGTRFNLDTWTLETLVYLEQDPADDVILIQRRSQPFGYVTFELGIRALDRLPYVRFQSPSGQTGTPGIDSYEVIGVEPVPLEEWMMLGGRFGFNTVINQNELSLFQNGARVRQRILDVLNATGPQSGPLILAENLNGRMDEVRIWSQWIPDAWVKSGISKTLLFGRDSVIQGALAPRSGRLETVSPDYILGSSENFTLQAWVRTTEDTIIVSSDMGAPPQETDSSFIAHNYHLEVDQGNLVGRATFVYSGALIQNPDAPPACLNRTRWATHEIQGGNVANGEWNHVAMVRDGNTISLYINGRPTGQGKNVSLFSSADGGSNRLHLAPGEERSPCDGPVVGLASRPNTPIYIGGNTIDDATLIDEVSLFAEAFSPGFIAENFLNAAPSRPSLRMHYTFDFVDVALGFVVDSASQANIGIFDGNATVVLDTDSNAPIVSDNRASLSAIMAGYFHFNDGGEFIQDAVQSREIRNYSAASGVMTGGVSRERIVPVYDGMGDPVLEDHEILAQELQTAYPVFFPLPSGSPYRLDSDGDGMPDVFESYFGLAPNDPVPPNRPEVGPWGDLSSNGLPNIYEYWAGTDPRFWSSRGDGVSDADWDSDGDGLSNITEFMMGSHPGRTDTDNNGISDWDELDPFQFGRINNPTHSMDPLDLESTDPRLRPKAMRLNDAVNRLQVPRPLFDRFRFNSSTWTIETWYRPDASGQTGSLMEYIGQRWESAGGNPNPQTMVFWRLGLDSGRPYVEFQTAEVQTPHRLTAQAEIPVGWSHLSASYNMANRMLTLYVDGVAVRQKEVVGQPLSGGDTVSRIPGRFWLGDENLRGLMNDVRLWHFARTPAQIQRGMTKLVQVNEPGLVTYYRFDDGRQGDLNDPNADGDGAEDGRGAEDFANRVMLPDLERAWSYSLRGVIFEPVSPPAPFTTITGETLNTADGVSSQYTGSTLQKYLVPNTVSLTVGTRFFVDNGTGILLGGIPGDSGTIDYTTGAWSLDLVVPLPLSGVNFELDYQHYPNLDFPPWARQGFDDRNQDGLPDWWEDLYYSVDLEFFRTVRDQNSTIVDGSSQRTRLVSSDSYHNALHTLGWSIDFTPLESVANVRLWEQPDAAYYLKSFTIMDIPGYAELRLAIHTLVDESELIRTEVRLNGVLLDLSDSRIQPSPNTFRSPDGVAPTELYLPSSMIQPLLRQGHNVMAVKMVNTNESSLNPYTYEFFDAQLLVDGQYYIKKANSPDASNSDRRWWVWGRLGSLEAPPRDFAGRQWFEPGYGNAALDDLDHDGLTNIQEFELGLNPAATDSSNLDSASGVPLLGAGDPDLNSGWYAGLLPDAFRIQPGSGLTFDELINPGDQIPFGWKQNYLNVLDANRFVKWDDPDGDGWNNFQEFLAGTDPGKINSIPKPNEMIVNILWNEDADATAPIVAHFWRTPEMDGPKVATGTVEWVIDETIGEGTLELTSGRFWPEMYGLFFADLNGNGEWDEGEPAGFAQDHPIQVNINTIQRINVALSVTVPGYIRWHFDPIPGQTNHTVRLIRATSSGFPVVFTRTIRGRNYVHEKDYQLAGHTYHLDPGSSALPGYDLYIKGEFEPDNAFVLNRQDDRRGFNYLSGLSVPSNLVPSGQIRYVNTEFSWQASSGVVTAYDFQLFKEGILLYERRINAPIPGMNGRVSYNPDVYWGTPPFEGGDYRWRVRAVNPDVTSNWAGAKDIFVNLSSHSNGPHDISGIYWYMGRATQGNFVFEAFDNPGFMGKPVQRTVVSDIGEWRLRGLPAGRYYLRGYRDVLGDDAYQAWHPVGYLKSPTAFSAYWQPKVVELRPLASGSSGHHIVIQDVDSDNDGFSDAWEMEVYGNLNTATSGSANVPYAKHSTLTGTAIQGLLPLDLSLQTADGYSKAALILLGYDPADLTDRPAVPLVGGNILELQGLGITNNQVWLDFSLLSGLNPLTRTIGVEVQYTTDLTSNIWKTIPTSRTEIGQGSSSWSLTPGMLPSDSGVFYRLRWFPLIP